MRSVQCAASAASTICSETSGLARACGAAGGAAPLPHRPVQHRGRGLQAGAGQVPQPLGDQVAVRVGAAGRTERLHQAVTPRSRQPLRTVCAPAVPRHISRRICPAVATFTTPSAASTLCRVLAVDPYGRRFVPPTTPPLPHRAGRGRCVRPACGHEPGPSPTPTPNSPTPPLAGEGKEGCRSAGQPLTVARGLWPVARGPWPVACGLWLQPLAPERAAQGAGRGNRRTRGRGLGRQAVLGVVQHQGLPPGGSRMRAGAQAARGGRSLCPGPRPQPWESPLGNRRPAGTVA